MAITLNHTIVPARDKKAAAQFFARIFGLQADSKDGHFAPVRTQLDAARSSQDWKFAAHSLKGSARSIGAPRVAAVADKLDAMAFEEPASRKSQLLNELDTAIAAFASEVKKAIG